MDFNKLKKIFKDHECSRLYVKKLAPNDNSKNQVYLGGSFEVLNILPILRIDNEPAGDWKKERYKAEIEFSWISEEGTTIRAPKSQLILYPKYPEVRFSGFLKRCKNAPSKLMTSRTPERLLFLGVTRNRSILGYVAAPSSPVANSFNIISNKIQIGVFNVIELPDYVDSKNKLISELRRIHEDGWIKSKRLDSQKNIMPCESSNCGGYTLEAELGIAPNGHSEPDYLGWEIKQFGVKSFNRIQSAVITLMTPEPTGGLYASDGAQKFIIKYGYKDVSGRQDRMNFGGIHKVGIRNTRTNLEIKLVGFDPVEKRIRNTGGKIVLLDKEEIEVASWSFASLLIHWNRKHNMACYVPSVSDRNGGRKYMYGNKVKFGIGTDFQYFLTQMSLGNIYYDPGIKMEHVSTTPKIKKRSQFRIKSSFLNNLYNQSEDIDVIQ